ncbi:MAG: MmgE/PrpD family protein [Alphaproteobacteria bacterium]|nr:MmgE/PrpD family protein [Alphaproteobacteria bacterium]
MTAAATISEQYAGFAHALRPLDMPPSVRAYAADLALDSTGIAFASTRYPFAASTAAALGALSEGKGQATVIGRPAGLPFRDAALMNAVLVHGLDYDDTHVRGIVHVSASLWPCVMAMGERVGASGSAVLTAYIAGIEVAARLGVAANNQFHQLGFHPTGVCGAFGCAIASGLLLGLTPLQLRHAQGIALSAASGSLEFVAEGAWTKRLNPGFAAVAGINAAYLAREDFVAPSRPYEGRDGLFNAYLGSRVTNADLPAATQALGTDWETLGVAVKPVAACHYALGIADAATAIARDHRPAAEDIESVTALVPRATFPTLCEPWEKKRRPNTGYDAKFSLPYIVAAGLLKGRCDIGVFEDDAVRNEQVLALADRVAYGEDLASSFPKAFSGEVIVRMKDGQVLRQREESTRGGVDQRLSRREIQDKFFENAEPVIGRKRAQAVAAAMEQLDETRDFRELLGLLGGKRPVQSPA